MIQQFGLPVNPGPTGKILADMDDLVFYEVVMEKRSEDAYLITGNIRHFPERSFIVTPAEMMTIIQKGQKYTEGQKKSLTTMFKTTAWLSAGLFGT